MMELLQPSGHYDPLGVDRSYPQLERGPEGAYTLQVLQPNVRAGPPWPDSYKPPGLRLVLALSRVLG